MVQGGLAPSTRQTYNTGIRAFHQFLSSHNISTQVPVSEFLLMSFASYYSYSCSRDTIETYIQGVRSWLIDNHRFVPMDPSNMPTLHRLLDGISLQCPVAPSVQKLPVTTALLSQMTSVLTSHYNDRLFFAVACLATYGLLRLGEVLPQRPTPGVPILRISDLRLTPTGFQLFIKKSKTDRMGNGHWAQFFSNGTPSCPFAAVISNYFVVFRKSALPSDPLFVLQDGVSEPSKVFIINKLKDTIRLLGLDPLQFSGHSFRRGGATSMAAAGVPDYIIKHVGRWKSDVYQIYTHVTQDNLVNASQQMATSLCVFGGRSSSSSSNSISK